MTGDRGQHAPSQGSAGSGGAPSGPPSLEQDFDAGSLYALRSAVAAHAAADGLPAGPVYEVVLAAHELAANAVRHGAGRGRLRLWSAGGVITCQVSDYGPPPADGAGSPATAGETPWPVEHGHGLWVVGQVADRFTVEHGSAGTTATAVFDLRGPR